MSLQRVSNTDQVYCLVIGSGWHSLVLTALYYFLSLHRSSNPRDDTFSLQRVSNPCICIIFRMCKGFNCKVYHAVLGTGWQNGSVVKAWRHDVTCSFECPDWLTPCSFQSPWISFIFSKAVYLPFFWTRESRSNQGFSAPLPDSNMKLAGLEHQTNDNRRSRTPNQQQPPDSNTKSTHHSTGNWRLKSAKESCMMVTTTIRPTWHTRQPSHEVWYRGRPMSDGLW